MAQARREIDIAVSPSRLMSVICDFEAYPLFLPWMRRAEVVSHERGPGPDQESWEVRFQLELIRPLVYTLRLERQGAERLSWSLVEGVLRTNDGAWTLSPLDGGLRTRATYEIDLQVGSFVPGNILEGLRQRELGELLERVRAEAEARFSVASG